MNCRVIHCNHALVSIASAFSCVFSHYFQLHLGIENLTLFLVACPLASLSKPEERFA